MKDEIRGDFSSFIKWKPGKVYYIPMDERPIHILNGGDFSSSHSFSNSSNYSYLHPGYMGVEIYLKGPKFLEAENITAYSCAHAFYACFMSNPKKAIDVALSSSVSLAKEKAMFYGPRKDWASLSTGLMEDIYIERFRYEFNDKRKLASTYGVPILPYIGKGDTNWGVIPTSYGYKGLNLIGKALMRYRSWLVYLDQ